MPEGEQITVVQQLKNSQFKKLRPNNRAGGVKVNEYAALLWMMAEKKFHWVDYGKTQRFGGGCIRLELE